MFLHFQIVLLVVTGPQYVHQPQSTAAAELKDSGVDVYAVGIGSSAVPLELGSVASRPEFVFQAGAATLPILSSQLTAMIHRGMLYKHHF